MPTYVLVVILNCIFKFSVQKLFCFVFSFCSFYKFFCYLFFWVLKKEGIGEPLLRLFLLATKDSPCCCLPHTFDHYCKSLYSTFLNNFLYLLRSNFPNQKSDFKTDRHVCSQIMSFFSKLLFFVVPSSDIIPTKPSPTIYKSLFSLILISV
jgi:hypothetical protein